MKIKTMVEKVVDVKSVTVSAKVRDSGCYVFKNASGEPIKSIEDSYVPDFFPTEHYGDYIELEIDLETGQILNWQKPTAEQLEQALNTEDDE